MTIALTGKMSGTADKHTADSLMASFENAWFAAARGAFEGKLSDAPENLPAAPILLFAHGSSGIGAPLKAFARFVSSLGWSFLAPDSFVFPDRITYSSPVSRENYARVHAMRSQELDYAARHLDEAPGFSGRYAVAGTSEGGRYRRALHGSRRPPGIRPHSLFLARGRQLPRRLPPDAYPRRCSGAEHHERGRQILQPGKSVARQSGRARTRRADACASSANVDSPYSRSASYALCTPSDGVRGQGIPRANLTVSIGMRFPGMAQSALSGRRF